MERNQNFSFSPLAPNLRDMATLRLKKERKIPWKKGRTGKNAAGTSIEIARMEPRMAGRWWRQPADAGWTAAQSLPGPSRG